MQNEFALTLKLIHLKRSLQRMITHFFRVTSSDPSKVLAVLYKELDLILFIPYFTRLILRYKPKWDFQKYLHFGEKVNQLRQEADKNHNELNKLLRCMYMNRYNTNMIPPCKDDASDTLLTSFFSFLFRFEIAFC